MGDADRVADWFRANGGRFGLAATAVTCRAVLNLGGFVNRSFTVDDGRRRLHVKLGDADAQSELARWAAVHEVLEARYGAPRLLGVVEGGPIAGEALALVFEHVAGRPPDPRGEPRVLGAALAIAAALHRDADLGARVGQAGPKTCADDLIDTYVRRFRDDLAECGPAWDDIPFLAPGFAAWAAAETDALEAAARREPAFAAPAWATVHGDLYAANLICSGERLCILDWDDLHAPGDGALDATNLLRPLLLRGQGDALLRAYAEAAQDPGALARAPLYRRAMLLDDIIDSMADHVEADALPEHAAAVRALKRDVHRDALALYRRAYGG